MTQESRYYRLEGTIPVPCTVLEWADAFERADRIVAQTNLSPTVRVSTVFLGLDHSFDPNGPPMLFETMIFGIEDDEYQTRCGTWEQALAMHEAALNHCYITLEVEIEERHNPR